MTSWLLVASSWAAVFRQLLKSHLPNTGRSNEIKMALNKILPARLAKRCYSKVTCFRNQGTAFTKKTIGFICMNGAHGICFSSLTTCSMAPLGKLPDPEK